LPGLPVVSGKDLVKAFSRLGYTLVRQRGSHAQLKCTTPAGEHTITIPMHDEIAPGTLNDILTRVALWKGLSKDELVRMIRQ
jgi:predicted RNA binding protein YcfA (HicA-like mRNA interferase family)